jgi:acetylornithine deacetylase/succinyl-diaminopimelate desuccinylase-like protein
MANWQSFITENRERYASDLDELLRIPSISALPNHEADVRRAASWVVARIESAGLENVRILETGGHPVVYADWLHAQGRPTILIYGHFDVQPVDPLDLWTDNPFQPTRRDGRIYARGASDMKANLLLSIEAVEALLQTDGALPLNIKFFIEGQEEIGSPQLPSLVADNADLLACDIVLSGDGVQWSEEQPAMTLAMRGGCGLQVDVRGPGGDLHSGMAGGAAPNPIHALVELLATLHAPDGSIAVDDFYADVVVPSDAEREAMRIVPFDERAFAEGIGAEGLPGEEGFTPLERIWARPTLEINGIWGGFQGAGVKTVIPSEAHAKITCRLVPKQNPDAVVAAIIRHIETHTPSGVQVTVDPLPFRSMPYFVPADFWGNEVLASVLEEVYGVPALHVRQGGSVPVCELFQTHLGAYTVTMGFGQEDEGAHAPNEFVRQSNLERGRHVWALMLTRLGVNAPQS